MGTLWTVRWHNIIGIVIFSIMFVRLPADSLRAMALGMFRYSVILLFAVYVAESVNVWVGVFLYAAILSSRFPQYSLQAYYSLEIVALYVGFYTLLVLKCQDFEKVMNFICVAVIIHCVFLIMQYYQIDPYKTFYRFLKGSSLSPTGLVNNKNAAGALIALGLPCFMRRFWYWFIPLLISGLIISASTGGFLASAAVILIYGMIHADHFGMKVLIITTTGCSIAYFLHNIDLPFIKPRIELYKKTWPLFKTAWWHGVGIGRWKVVNTKLIRAGYLEPGWLRMHNTFIQATVEMGAGFLILLYGYTLTMWARIVNKSNYKLLAPLAAIAIVANANSVFRMNTVNGMIIVFWLAYIERSLKGGKHEILRSVYVKGNA